MERDSNRSGPAKSVSPWAQLILIAAAFCVGRATVPSRFVEAFDVERPAPKPAAAPVREMPRPLVARAEMSPPTVPVARPPRPHMRLRTAPPPTPRPEALALARTEPEEPTYGVVSRVFFGLEGPGTLPTKISGPDPTYTGPALDHEVQGVMRVACVVTTDGEVDRCRVLHGLPYMDVAVLKALHGRRYEPARLANGRPVETEYVFVVRLLLQGELLID